MTLTKKHFKAVTEVLNPHIKDILRECKGQVPDYAQIEHNLFEIVTHLSDYFKTLNPNFDEVKFREACLK